MCYQAGVVTPVYTARVTTRHDELDRFGRLHPSAYLRYLAHAAVEASTAVGFDAAWYAAAGTVWIVRRSTFEVSHPVGTDERLAIRTWVEDFRRVRSHRRYEVRGAAERLCLEARTDWVYVDTRSGRPRRVPPEMEAAFGAAHSRPQEREPWSSPPPPASPALAHHRVRMQEVDTFGHVNNAAYLDIAVQGMLDVLEDAGWSLDRMIGANGVPLLVGADLEYLEGARYGDRLAIPTWFTPGPSALEAHQYIVRSGAGRPLLRASTRWRWAEPASGAQREVPGGVLAALRRLRAA